ncbi:MAG: nucleoside-diphosphate kinase [Promethearchaeota archaeon]
MEKSLVFLKPDAVLRKGIGAAILQKFLNNENFMVLAFKEVIVNEDLAQKHYQEHKGKNFYPWLVKSIRATPVLAMIVQGEIQKVRDFLGATFVQKANSNTIRGQFGIWGGVNSVHASDSVETGFRELNLWRKLANLQEDLDTNDKMQAYIQEWIKYSKTNNTLKLRDLCKDLAEKKITQDQIHKKLVLLLKEDCPLADSETIRKFATIIIENILL